MPWADENRGQAIIIRSTQIHAGLQKSRAVDLKFGPLGCRCRVMEVHERLGIGYPNHASQPDLKSSLKPHLYSHP